MDDKLLYMPNDDTQNYPFVDLNYWLKSLDINRFASGNQYPMQAGRDNNWICISPISINKITPYLTYKTFRHST